jgi:hypothetical protein
MAGTKPGHHQLYLYAAARFCKPDKHEFRHAPVKTGAGHGRAITPPVIGIGTPVVAG